MLIEVANADDRGRLFDLEERRLLAQRVVSILYVLAFYDIYKGASIAAHHQPLEDFYYSVGIFTMTAMIVSCIIAFSGMRSRRERREKCIQSGTLLVLSSTWTSMVLLWLVMGIILGTAIYGVSTHWKF